MMLLVFAGFLFFIFYLDRIQKSNLEKNLLIHQAYRAFEKNLCAFLDLSPLQQQNFLDQLEENNRAFFLELIENEVILPSNPEEINTMNLFASWAREQNMHSAALIEWNPLEDYSYHSA